MKQVSMAKRMLKPRRKTAFTIMVFAGVFLIIIIYYLCNTKYVFNRDLYKSSDKEYQNYLHECSKVLQIEHVYIGDNSTYFAKNSGKSAAKSGTGNEQLSKTKAQETEISSHLSDDAENILVNISFSSLKHVIVLESDNFYNQFHNWTKTYMLVRHKNSFEMPKWSVKGSEICDVDTEMIIIVPAVPDYVFTRELIRQTWASYMYGIQFPQMLSSSLRTKLAFVFGTSGLPDFKKAILRREGESYHDIIAADFVDSYRNLTLKMMVSLNWVSEFCSNVKYVLKTDMDTFVNIPLLSRFLLEISKSMPHFIIGHRHDSQKPPVLRLGKWGVSKEDYPFDHFPPYLLGHSYIITGGLVPPIVSVGKRLPLIPTEDAHITGIIARVVQAPILHYDGFAKHNKKVLSCRVLFNYDISVTTMSVRRLIMIWRDLLTGTCSKRELPLRSNGFV